jgi:Ca-activated chloride channel family protein
MYGLLVFLLALAMARPRAGKTVELVHSQGVDIMVALDVSGSMAGGRDLRPNRLAVAKRVLDRFIAGRKHDRIGMVIFAGAAFTRCPLTLDYGILRALLEALDHKAVAVDGTAIGTALGACVNRLRDSQASSKVVILITDGANNAGAVAPEDAAAMAKELGIKLYTIGVGAKDPPKVNASNVNYFQFLAGTPALDEPLLRKLAETTGGRYFRATDSAALEGIFQIIDRLERSELEAQSFTRYRELYWPLLATCLVLLLTDMLLGLTLTRSLP